VQKVTSQPSVSTLMPSLMISQRFFAAEHDAPMGTRVVGLHRGGKRAGRRHLVIDDLPWNALELAGKHGLGKLTSQIIFGLQLTSAARFALGAVVCAPIGVPWRLRRFNMFGTCSNMLA